MMTRSGQTEMFLNLIDGLKLPTVDWIVHVIKSVGRKEGPPCFEPVGFSCSRKIQGRLTIVDN